MAYIGQGTSQPVGPQGGGTNTQYTNLGRFPQALYIVRGTVLVDLQGLQTYDVATDFGRFTVMALGGGVGRLGAGEFTGYLPGEQVWVAISPSQPAFNGFILGRASYSVDGDYTPASGLLVYPQVVGFEPDTRMSGAMYSAYARLRNFNSGILDAVDGDWFRHNMLGGALGIEAFRAFLQGGPMAGVYCYSDDPHTRIVGARFERITFGEEYEDRQMGSNIIQIRKRVFYPGDALADLQPQELEVSGPVFGGRQQFHTYPDGSNIEEETSDDSDTEETVRKGRVSLLHEYRGLDGSYVLSSAASIILQKTVEIPVPDHALSGGDPASCSVCEPVDAPPVSGDDGADHTAIAQAPRVINSSSTQTLVMAMSARGLADRLVSWQARGGFDDLNDWSIGEKPETVYGEKTSAELAMSKDPNMWKAVPQVFTLSVDPYGTEKRYYFGKAMIAITEDGSIVLQDAQGGQFMLAGGNAYTSVPHDIINVAGRNLMNASGRDSAYRSGRHTDIVSTEGRTMVASAGQLALTGGHDGNSGVLIESKGEHGYTQRGENPYDSGGVIIKTNQLVGIKAGNITLSTKNMGGWSPRSGGAGLITFDAGETVLWRAHNSEFWGCLGATISAKVAGGHVILGKHSVLPSLTVPNRLTYGRLLHLIVPLRGGSPGFADPDWAWRGRELLDGLDYMLDGYNSVDSSPLFLSEQTNDDKGEYQAQWLSSQQYNISRNPVFQLPEPEWQVRMREVATPDSVILTSTMRDQPIDGTSPFPGREAWAEDERMIRIDINTLEWGETAPDTAPATEFVKIEGNLLKGI